MNVKHWLAASTLSAGLCLAALPASARQQQQQGSSQQSTAQQSAQQGTADQQSSDPVAEAARKAREQQKTAPKPKKVYTDDDIPSRASSSDASAKTGQGSADAQASTDSNAPASKDDPETTWKKKFADQRAKIATAEKELDILQKEEQKAQVQYYSDPQKALTEQNTRQDINDKDAQIAQKKQEIDDLKQQLEDMEDELRKSGGDPGWARE